jgi:alpha,alpha-trehalase
MENNKSCLLRYAVGIWIGLVAVLCMSAVGVMGDSTTVADNIARACTIYCHGPVLETIQMSYIYNDSKTFVDMPMKYDPEDVMANFTALPNHRNTTLIQFLNDNFYSVGSDLEDWTPTDYVENPAFLQTVTNTSYRQWASDINGLWLLLGKQTAASVSENPQRHSFVPIG